MATTNGRRSPGWGLGGFILAGLALAVIIGMLVTKADRVDFPWWAWVFTVIVLAFGLYKGWPRRNEL